MLMTMRRVCLAGALAGVATFGAASSALAHTGEFAKFNNCPSTNTEVRKCIDSITVGGKVVIGKKNTPIEHPVTLQGGYGKPNAEHISLFYGATNGETLSKTPQAIPGGLAGLVNCKEISEFLERIACELTFENGLTGVNATLELAKPASEIRISEFNLLLEEGLALKLPVKVHLENPFLGSTCYVGSSSHPLIWNLTTGEVGGGLKGTSGLIELKEEAEIAVLVGNELVENQWTAPGATGCSEPFSLIIDPILDASIGLPIFPWETNKAGENTAVLKNNVSVASAVAVNEH
jgi:hypothetical protein